MNYAGRQRRVLAANPVGAFVTTAPNIAYLGGVRVHASPDRPARLELAPDGRTRLVLNRVSAAVTSETTWYFDGETPPPPPPGFIAADELVAEARRVKDEEEQALVIEAAELAAWGQAPYRRLLIPGESFLTIRAAVAEELAREATRRDAAAFWDIRVGGAAGPMSASPHAPERESGRSIDQTDAVIAVIVVGKSGYYAECERTYLLPAVDAELRDLLVIVLEAQERAIAACATGAPVASIDVTSRAVFERAESASAVLHRAGHGMGLLPQEWPLASPRSQDLFAEGNVMAIEPALYLSGVGGCRQSDTVIVGRGPITSLAPSSGPIDTG